MCPSFGLPSVVYVQQIECKTTRFSHVEFRALLPWSKKRGIASLFFKLWKNSSNRFQNGLETFVKKFQNSTPIISWITISRETNMPKYFLKTCRHFSSVCTWPLGKWYPQNVNSFCYFFSWRIFISTVGTCRCLLDLNGHVPHLSAEVDLKYTWNRSRMNQQRVKLTWG